MNLHISRICILSLIAIVGCGGSTASDRSKERLNSIAGGKMKDVVPVKGKVLVDGQPLKGILLELWANPPTDRPIRNVIAEEDGKYCWSRYALCDGLEPGSYKVTFKHLEKPKKERSDDLFKGKFADAKKSKHELTVEAGKPQENVDYDLATK